MSHIQVGSVQRTQHKQKVSPLFQGLGGLLLLAATLAGVVGTVYKFMEPGGWLAVLADRGIPGGLVAFGALVAVGALAVIGPQRPRRWSGNIVMYLFAGAGAYFLAHLLARGTL